MCSTLISSCTSSAVDSSSPSASSHAVAPVPARASPSWEPQAAPPCPVRPGDFPWFDRHRDRHGLLRSTAAEPDLQLRLPCSQVRGRRRGRPLAPVVSGELHGDGRLRVERGLPPQARAPHRGPRTAQPPLFAARTRRPRPPAALRRRRGVDHLPAGGGSGHTRSLEPSPPFALSPLPSTPSGRARTAAVQPPPPLALAQRPGLA